MRPQRKFPRALKGTLREIHNTVLSLGEISEVGLFASDIELHPMLCYLGVTVAAQSGIMETLALNLDWFLYFYKTT